jgi:hypothetical protein
MKRKTLVFIGLLTLIISISINNSNAQCCAAGGGSPIASDISQSVLMLGQMEISANYQFVNSTKFLTTTTTDVNYLDRFTSNYMYTKLAYGVTKELTISVESGYWLDKTQIGLDAKDTINSSGIADFIVFPRLNLYNKNNTEITAGMGLKIPLGSYNDSIGYYEPFTQQTFYVSKPPALQASSGSSDFIFSLFYARRFPAAQFRLFTNVMYIRKGWNPVGEKLGDYASISIFGGKTFFTKLNVLLHVKFEWINKMSINDDIRMYAGLNFDPEATGSKKIFVMPQLNYSILRNLNVFVLGEIPVYQYVNKTQIASQLQITGGLSYRFALKKPVVVEKI